MKNCCRDLVLEAVNSAVNSEVNSTPTFTRHETECYNLKNVRHKYASGFSGSVNQLEKTTYRLYRVEYGACIQYLIR